MVADVLPFDAFTLPRVLQLIQRSNQFNLTTIRYSQADLVEVTCDQKAEAFCVRLLDRLGDNGVIAALILRYAGPNLVIDTWVMSCRVLGRNVEEFIVEEVVRRARDAGCTRVIGRYVPTKKNALVAGLYQRLGFSQSEQTDTVQLSVLEVDSYHSPRYHIANGRRDQQERA